MTRGKIVKHNAYQALISMDQALYNLGGTVWACVACLFYSIPTGVTYADETLSSRAWRWERDGVCHWPRKVIDAVFWWQPDHCLKSYISEREGRQQPPELRGV